MSSVDNILDSKSEAYYDPAADFSGVMPEGSYKAYATELTVKENLVIKNKYLADVYEVTFEVAKENSDNTYERDGKEVSGKVFVGKNVKSKGFFRFKKPDPSTYPGLEENSGSNKSYKELVESFSVSLEEDSEGRFFLPSVDESDIAGMPVLIDVYHSKWVDNEGKDRTTPRVGAIYTWDGQKKKEEDLPF